MITEIMYHPVGPALAGGLIEDFEFIELQNVGDTLTLDLTNVEFTKGIDFKFSTGTITSLPPGARALVVKNLTAFQSRYGTQLPVAGVWDPADNLNNAGDQVKLVYGDNEPIHDFIYDDKLPWPETPDGNGPSLTLIDPVSRPDHALFSNWRASSLLYGSPGAGDTSFDLWLAAQGSTDPAAGMFPGMTYLMAYAIGADLAIDPQAAFPTAGYLADVDGNHLTLSFRKRTDANDVAYIVETSTTLETWQSGPADVEPVPPPVDNGDGTETITVRVVAPVSASPVAFVRLRMLLDQ